MRDSNPKRHCTVPKILGFRSWFERNYGHICERHDQIYMDGGCRICSDVDFIKDMIRADWEYDKKYLFFSVPAALPIFILFQINTAIDFLSNRL